MNNLRLLSIIGLSAIVLILPGVYAQNQIDDKYLSVDDVNTILDYCYLHADRANPVQDLVDKGLVSAEFKGDTCSSVKRGNEHANAVITLEGRNVSSVYDNCVEYAGKDEGIECSDVMREYCNNLTNARLIPECG